MTAPLTLARRIDPRLHLSAAIGWAVFAVVTLAALAAATLASAEAEGRARADAQALLGEFATQVRDALSHNLCRCGTHLEILAAVDEAARLMGAAPVAVAEPVAAPPRVPSAGGSA